MRAPQIEVVSDSSVNTVGWAQWTKGRKQMLAGRMLMVPKHTWEGLCGYVKNDALFSPRPAAFPFLVENIPAPLAPPPLQLRPLCQSNVPLPSETSPARFPKKALCARSAAPRLRLQKEVMSFLTNRLRRHRSHPPFQRALPSNSTQPLHLRKSSLRPADRLAPL